MRTLDGAGMSDPCIIDRPFKPIMSVYEVYYANDRTGTCMLVAETFDPAEDEKIKEVIEGIEGLDLSEAYVFTSKNELIGNTVVDDNFFKKFDIDDIPVKRAIWQWEQDHKEKKEKKDWRDIFGPVIYVLDHPELLELSSGYDATKIEELKKKQRDAEAALEEYKRRVAEWNGGSSHC